MCGAPYTPIHSVCVVECFLTFESLLAYLTIVRKVMLHPRALAPSHHQPGLLNCFSEQKS